MAGFVGQSGVWSLPRLGLLRAHSNFAVLRLDFRGVSVRNSGNTGVSMCVFSYLGQLCQVAAGGVRFRFPPRSLLWLCCLSITKRGPLSLSLSLGVSARVCIGGAPNGPKITTEKTRIRNHSGGQDCGVRQPPSGDDGDQGGLEKS
jgi:hypothetical protein